MRHFSSLISNFGVPTWPSSRPMPHLAKPWNRFVTGKTLICARNLPLLLNSWRSALPPSIPITQSVVFKTNVGMGISQAVTLRTLNKRLPCVACGLVRVRRTPFPGQRGFCSSIIDFYFIRIDGSSYLNEFCSLILYSFFFKNQSKNVFFVCNLMFLTSLAKTNTNIGLRKTETGRSEISI